MMSDETDLTLAKALGQFLAPDESPWELRMVGSLTAGAVES